jgi:hypothetical protein
MLATWIAYNMPRISKILASTGFRGGSDRWHETCNFSGNVGGDTCSQCRHPLVNRIVHAMTGYREKLHTLPNAHVAREEKLLPICHPGVMSASEEKMKNIPAYFHSHRC